MSLESSPANLVKSVRQADISTTQTIYMDVENKRYQEQCIRLFSILQVAAVLVLSACSGLNPVYAQVERSVQQGSQKDSTLIEKYSYERAKVWSLSEQEWTRYRNIMQGSRGLWTPDLDPIMVLGIYARTPEETKKYARMAAEQEFERVGKEVAFQQAYDQAINKIINEKGVLPIDIEKIKNRKKTRLDKTQPGDRVLYFTRLDCGECIVVARKLSTRAAQSQGFPLDIYLVGTAVEDNARIRSWAKQVQVDTTSVKQRKITINHDSGVLERLGDVRPPIILLKRMTGDLDPVSLVDLGL